jgi:hypothetical protein
MLRVGTEGLDPEVARQLDAGQIAKVLTRVRELACLLHRAAQERGADPRALEQHGNGRAKRPGPDDRGTTRMLAGVADGGRRYRLRAAVLRRCELRCGGASSGERQR